MAVLSSLFTHVDHSMIRPFSLHITSEAEPANNLGRISIENFDAITNLERVLYYEEALAREDLRGRVGWERRRRQEERPVRSDRDRESGAAALWAIGSTAHDL